MTTKDHKNAGCMKADIVQWTEASSYIDQAEKEGKWHKKTGEEEEARKDLKVTHKRSGSVNII